MEHSDWYQLIKERLPDGYFAKINQFITQSYRQTLCYPKRENIFKALQLTSYKETKVVILGQDPYHGLGQAQGLSFSVPNEIKAPPSLVNILKELQDDIGYRESHDLTGWANQGVLLLNACLTVEDGHANSHQGLIWEPFTDAIIALLNEKNEGVVFILWGAFARKKKSLITNKHHLIIESAHPSPLSSYRGFFGSCPFSRANQFLEKDNQSPIDWLK